MWVRKIGIDLGTCNSLVYIPGKGVVLNEPSVVAVSLPENKILAVGNEAKEMLGKTPDTIVAYRPLKDGVIADFRVTQAMIQYFLNKVTGRFSFLKPELVISVPAGITSTERRAVIEAALNAGAKSAYVAKEPILSAIGAGIPINSPTGNMLIDIGGGTSETAVISLGGIVAWSSVRVGGNKMDQAISSFIKNKYNLAIGDQMAEDIKINIGSALPVKEKEEMEIRGRDLISGLPKTIESNTNEVCEGISSHLKEITQSIKEVLRNTPPELIADVIDKGMILAGGGALLKNIDTLFTNITGVPSYIADEPLFCVAKGTGMVLENLEVYKRSIMSKK